MDIELWNGDTKAIIDTEGAWLTNLSDQSGDIFFPKRSLRSSDGATKIRGGCHVCLPNFGPDAANIQPQHGFARTSQWVVARQSLSSATLTLSGVEGEYAPLVMELLYEVLPMGLRMELTVRNTGSIALRCAPGFHPYFSLARSENEVRIDDESCMLEDLDEVQFTEGQVHTLTTQARAFTLRTKGLPVLARWTDMLAPYICIEPTLAGFSFNQATPLDIEMLLAGEHRRYELTVEWRHVA